MIFTSSMRPIVAGDGQALFALYDQLDHHAPSPSYPDAEQRLADYVRQLSAWPQSGLWGIVDGAGKLLGSYSIIVIPLLVHGGRHIGIVESVVVDEGQRGQGFGAHMMNHAAAQARQAGCYKLMLSSNLRRQRAHDFYEGLGFQRHGFSYHLDLE